MAKFILLHDIQCFENITSNAKSFYIHFHEKIILMKRNLNKIENLKYCILILGKFIGNKEHNYLKNTTITNSLL